jgi:hypothetical protein
MIMDIQDIEILKYRISEVLTPLLKTTDFYVNFVPYTLHFFVNEYEGVTLFTRPVPPLEQAILGILSVEGNCSFDKIGDIVGFKVIQDSAEASILEHSLEQLRKMGAIEGSDDVICLTPQGKTFASVGKSQESENYKFKLWVDYRHKELLNLQDCLQGDMVLVSSKDASENDLSIDEIRQIASKQAQHAHNPSDERFLESANLKKQTEYTYQLYVCFVRDVLTNNLKIHVYDDNQHCMLNDLSSVILNDKELLNELMSHVPEDTFVPEEDIKDESESSLSSISESNEISIEVADEIGVKRLHKRSLYDEMTFETELKTIFTEDNPDEIWLISPWIGYFFVKCRLPMIKTALENGRKVFIAYSKKDPRDKSQRNEMVDPTAQSEIDKLIASYPNFYCAELINCFHTKNVFEVKGDQCIMFSGSFNVLSFAIQENNKVIRGEQMTFVHVKTAYKNYMAYREEFAEIFLNKAKDRISNLSSEDIVKYSAPRLRYFINTTKGDEIKDFYDELDFKKTLAHRDLWISGLNSLKKMLGPTIANGSITRQDQNHVLGEISKLEANIDSFAIPEEATNTLRELKGKVMDLCVTKKAETLKDEKGYSIVSTSSEVIDYSVALSKILTVRATHDLSEQKRASRIISQHSNFGNERQVIKFLAAANLTIAAIKAKKERYINFGKINSLIVKLVQESESKYPNLSIIIDGQSLIFDLYGIQFSFYRVPIGNNERKIIKSRSNKVTDIKRQNTYLYSNEIFNLVAPIQ